MVLAIALAVALTVLVVRPDSGSDPSPTSGNGSDSELASVNDTGPVTIISEDPTCDAWGRVSRELAAQTTSVNWAERDQSIPAASWTPEQRAMYETAGKALTNAANLTVNLVRQTPHRVMRELYEQFIAYTRVFVNAIPSYENDDRNLSNVLFSASSGLSNICASIVYRSAQPLAPLVPLPSPPTEVSTPADLNAPERFLSASSPVCAEFVSLGLEFNDDTAAWRAIDPKIPATEWNPEQRSINNAVATVMSANADEMERLGRQSGNPVLEDFAILAAQYRRAFAIAIPNYTSADNSVSEAGTFLAKTVDWACKAAS